MVASYRDLFPEATLDSFFLRVFDSVGVSVARVPFGVNLPRVLVAFARGFCFRLRGL